jgi:hypothetical protein
VRGGGHRRGGKTRRPLAHTDGCSSPPPRRTDHAGAGHPPRVRALDPRNRRLARRTGAAPPPLGGKKRRLLDEFTVEYTHDSAAIEGNSLTLSETVLVLQGVTIGEKPLKDHLEAIGHRDAFRYLCGRVADGGLPDEWFIRELHSLMLDGYPPVNVKYADRRRYYDAFTAYHRDGDNAPMVFLVAEYVRARLRQTLSLLGPARMQSEQGTVKCLRCTERASGARGL